MGGALLTPIDLLLRGALVAVLLLLAAAWVRERPRTRVAQAGIALALGLSLASLGNAPAIASLLEPSGRAPWVGLAQGNAVLFALFARALFDDGGRWRAWHLLAWGVVTGLAAARCGGWWPMTATGNVGLIASLLDGVPIVCAAWVVGEALAHWRGDLVERRRQLRWFVAVGGSLDMLAMLWVRQQSPQGQLPTGWASAEVTLQLAIATSLGWSLLRLRPNEVFDGVRPTVVAELPGVSADVPASTIEAPSPVAVQVDRHAEPDRELAETLNRLMTGEQLYRSESLTIASLAQRLGVPEYRLRRVINQRLGHRHFNAFVNGYRLAEARAALADPALRSRPVLSIALDAGFQSIGPFNRAFKAATGLTPTEFRQKALAES